MPRSKEPINRAQFETDVNVGDLVRLMDHKGTQCVGYIAKFTESCVELNHSAFVTQKDRRNRGGLMKYTIQVEQWTSYKVLSRRREADVREIE